MRHANQQYRPPPVADGEQLDRAPLRRHARRLQACDARELPEDLNDFWRYFDAVVESELENTEAARIILYRLFDHLPAPALLDGAPALWAAGRAVVGPLLGAITVASLPEPYRRRAGLPEMPGAATLIQGAYLAAGLTRFLPEGWIDPESIIEALSLSPDSKDPRARTVTALRARLKRASALLRLLTPLSGGTGPDPVPASAGPGIHAAECFVISLGPEPSRASMSLSTPTVPLRAVTRPSVLQRDQSVLLHCYASPEYRRGLAGCRLRAAVTASAAHKGDLP